MARFSKRHYEMVAQAMQDSSPAINVDYEDRAVTAARRVQWEITVAHLAEVFARDNAAFNTDRFLRACEYGANVKARS